MCHLLPCQANLDALDPMAAAAAAQLAAASLASGAKNAPPMYVATGHDCVALRCIESRLPSCIISACWRGLQ